VKASPASPNQPRRGAVLAGARQFVLPDPRDGQLCDQHRQVEVSPPSAGTHVPIEFCHVVPGQHVLAAELVDLGDRVPEPHRPRAPMHVDHRVADQLRPRRRRTSASSAVAGGSGIAWTSSSATFRNRASSRAANNSRCSLLRKRRPSQHLGVDEHGRPPRPRDG
jgi:hypothetical protein